MSNCITFNTKASGIKRYNVSSRSNAATSYCPPIATTPIFLTIDGALSEGRRLTHPIVVRIEDDESEIIVSENHFHMHASGETVSEAIVAFKRIFSGYLDLLSEDEETLGTYLQEQLKYLRSAIKVD